MVPISVNSDKLHVGEILVIMAAALAINGLQLAKIKSRFSGGKKKKKKKKKN